jgi:hypothetical protein
MSRPWGWKNYSFLQFGIWSENRGEKYVAVFGVQGVMLRSQEFGKAEFKSMIGVIVAKGVAIYFCEVELAERWQLLLINGIDQGSWPKFSRLVVELERNCWVLRVGGYGPAERSCGFKEVLGPHQAHSGGVISTGTGCWECSYDAEDSKYLTRWEERCGRNRGLKAMVWNSYGLEIGDITRVSLLQSKESRPLEPLLFTQPFPYQRAGTVLKTQKKKKKKKKKSLFTSKINCMTGNANKA